MKNALIFFSLSLLIPITTYTGGSSSGKAIVKKSHLSIKEEKSTSTYKTYIIKTGGDELPKKEISCTRTYEGAGRSTYKATGVEDVNPSTLYKLFSGMYKKMMQSKETTLSFSNLSPKERDIFNHLVHQENINSYLANLKLEDETSSDEEVIETH